MKKIKKVSSKFEIINGPILAFFLLSQIFYTSQITYALRPVLQCSQTFKELEEILPVISDTDCELISQQTHVLVYSYPQWDYIIKIRNESGDINNSFSMYRKLKDNRIKELAHTIFITNLPIRLSGKKYVATEAVVQEKLTMLDELIMMALEREDLDKAKGYLKDWAHLQIELYKQGILDKMFTTTSTDRYRKFWLNVGQNKAGRLVYCDFADLTDKTIGIEVILSSMPNLLIWFDALYQGSEKDKLEVFLETEIIEFLKIEFIKANSKKTLGNLTISSCV